MSIRAKIFETIEVELDRAYAKHGKLPWGRHEAKAIIEEEFEEFWDVVKKDGFDDALVAELIETAAMCIRYLETGDRYRGPLRESIDTVFDIKQSRLLAFLEQQAAAAVLD